MMLKYVPSLISTDRAKVLYHANCADGFTAAWVVKKYFDTQFPNLVLKNRITFWPCNYNQPIPCDLDSNDIVYMVDFCHTPEVMEEIFLKAKYIIVLDHHKSAIDRMRNFIQVQEQNNPVTNYHLEFDINRSGAGITWDFFFEDEARPAIVTHVEDRDLWRFLLTETRAINANLFSYEYTFENWDFIAQQIEDPIAVSRKTFVAAGEAIERKHFKDIREMLDFHTNKMIIGDRIVPVVSVPYMWSSDACNILCKECRDIAGDLYPFAAAFWFIRKETGEPAVQFSLRSVGDFDVAKIAEQYQGGGHKNAAGFVVDFMIFQEMIKDFYWTSE